VVLGVRPESFEDAATAGERAGHLAVTATVDVLESTGSDVYAHLSLNGHGRLGSDSDNESLLRELAQATASEDPEVALAAGSELVARVGVSHSLAEGQAGRLLVDVRRVLLFDPATGRRISS
jgi:ABC-type sugar transport system ATPase subunit